MRGEKLHGTHLQTLCGGISLYILLIYTHILGTVSIHTIYAAVNAKCLRIINPYPANVENMVSSK
jgi:hypothetical protein